MPTFIALNHIVWYSRILSAHHVNTWTPILNLEGVKNMSKFVKLAVGALAALLSLAAVGGIIHELMRDDGSGLPY
jgi:hypothetical protein